MVKCNDNSVQSTSDTNNVESSQKKNTQNQTKLPSIRWQIFASYGSKNNVLIIRSYIRRNDV